MTCIGVLTQKSYIEKIQFHAINESKIDDAFEKVLYNISITKEALREIGDAKEIYEAVGEAYTNENGMLEPEFRCLKY